MKNWMKRAIRTFIQAFAGTFSTGIAVSMSNVSDMDTFQTALVSLAASGIAAGVAAVMNIKDEKSIQE